MGTAEMKGTKFVVTIAVAPTFNEEGLLNLEMSKMNVGALNVSVFARMMAKKMYAKQASEMEIDMESLRNRAVASLLSGEAFEAVFEFEGQRVGVEEITIETGKMIIRLVPL